MRTVAALRNKGVATQLLTYVIEFAIANGYQTLSLETGTQGYFNAARQLYAKNGFKDCEPFGNYQLNPNSHFMTKPLVNIDISPSSPPKWFNTG